MKFSMVAMALILCALSAQAETCGLTKREFINGDTVVVMTDIAATARPNTVLAISSNAKAFLWQAGLFGASVCNTDATAEAPFYICFIGNENELLATQIYCGDNSVCSGIHCGE